MMTRLLAVLILLVFGLSGCTFGIKPDYKAADPGQGFQQKRGPSEGGGGGGGY